MLEAAEVADDRRQRGRHDRLVERRDEEHEEQRAEDQAPLTRRRFSHVPPIGVALQQCLDVQRCGAADHPEQAAAHTEPPLIDGRRRLEREPVARRLHRDSELERLGDARHLEVAHDLQDFAGRRGGRGST